MRRDFPILASSLRRSMSIFWKSSNSSTERATIWFTVSSSGTSFSSYKNQTVLECFWRPPQEWEPLRRRRLDAEWSAGIAGAQNRWISGRTCRPGWLFRPCSTCSGLRLKFALPQSWRSSASKRALRSVGRCDGRGLELAGPERAAKIKESKSCGFFIYLVWVPVWVKNHHSVSALQIEAQASGPGTEEEDKILAVFCVELFE